MDIHNKIEPDPVKEHVLPDAYMRWALLAAEEVVGKQGLAVVLRQNDLGQLVDDYPPNELGLSKNLKAADYANLFSGLMGFYGRAGKSMLLRIGRLSAKHAIEQQAGLFNLAAVLALKMMPTQIQLKTGLDNMQNGLRKLWSSFGEKVVLQLEDRGDAFIYQSQNCSMCAGKQSDSAMCMAYTGVLMESTRWFTGKDFEIREIECRAAGATACAWEIIKQPKGS